MQGGQGVQGGQGNKRWALHGGDSQGHPSTLLAPSSMDQLRIKSLCSCTVTVPPFLIRMYILSLAPKLLHFYTVYVA